MTYIHLPHHRSAAYAPQKSQWTISEAEEAAVYQSAVAQNWQSDACYWGLRLINACPSELGVSKQPDTVALKIAKFVGDTNTGWHGYPVAHWLSPWDKPGVSILQYWTASGLITKASMSRIHRGKRCNL